MMSKSGDLRDVLNQRRERFVDKDLRSYSSCKRSRFRFKDSSKIDNDKALEALENSCPLRVNETPSLSSSDEPSEDLIVKATKNKTKKRQNQIKYTRSSECRKRRLSHRRISSSSTRRRENRHQRTQKPNQQQQHRKDSPNFSWESKVEAFIHHLERNSETKKSEDEVLSPLIRFVGKRLKGFSLVLKGLFEYSLLSLLSRSEWVAAQTLSLLKSLGYDESKLYSLATHEGALSLETQLKSAIFSQKSITEKDPEILSQILRTIDLIVKYFTAVTDDSEDSEERGSGHPVRTGMAEFLKGLGSQDEENLGKNLKEDIKENPWSKIENSIQLTNYTSFSDLKVFLAKDLLRQRGSSSVSPDAFTLASEMISTWVDAGFHLDQLKRLVLKTPVEDILPPLSGVFPNGKKYLFDLLKTRLQRISSSSKSLSTEHLHYSIRKTLIYVMRGLNKMPSSKGFHAHGSLDIVFNYLPPGLREEEKQASLSKTGNGRGTEEPEEENDDEEEQKEEGNDTEKRSKEFNIEHPSEESKDESTDPLNSILNPRSQITTQRPNVLPNRRRYLLISLHIEWVLLAGHPIIYEMSLYVPSDMSKLNLYCVPETLEKYPETLENLGFVANPDRHEYYYVAVGIGCLRALSLAKAMESLSGFLEDKRNVTETTFENKNNGLILLVYSEEELGTFLSVLEETNQSHLLLDVVKGFGTLEYFIESNKSKGLFYGGPKLSCGGQEVFYQTDVKRNLASSTIVSKSKAEALHLSLEFYMEGAHAVYKNFIGPYCFPSFSPQSEALKTKLSHVRNLYTLEVYLAAGLQANRTVIALEGPFAPYPNKDLRDKASIVSHRLLLLLVKAGFTKETLKECYKRDKDFTINSSVILDKMNMASRLAVMDQTLRCIALIKTYFSQ